MTLLTLISQNTWNSFACDINETVVLDAARRIVDLGFKDLGYEYVVMDDCWSAGRNSSGYLVPDKKKFPNGIAHVAEKIHEMGLKVGIYSSAGSMTCARYAGSLGYEQEDADVWASWGVSPPPRKTNSAIDTNHLLHVDRLPQIRQLLQRRPRRHAEAILRPLQCHEQGTEFHRPIHRLLHVQLGRRWTMELRAYHFQLLENVWGPDQCVESG